MWLWKQRPARTLRLAWGALALARSAAWGAEPLADDWFTGTMVEPDTVRESLAAAGLTDSLHAELLAGRFKVFWDNPEVPSNATVRIWASADAPGHWLARDWRPYDMAAIEGRWEATLPVDDVDVPYLYFLQVQPEEAGASGYRSVMRMATPRRMGLEQPTRVFWAFLEGFEEGLDSWRVLSDQPADTVLELCPTTRNGKAALQVTVPAGKRSLTVATTRLRGWQILQQGATGFSLWMRTETGLGLARFTLLSHAFETNQVVAPYQRDITLSPDWQRVELHFDSFRDAAPGSADLISINLVGRGPCRFILDDLQLVGNWPVE